MIVLTLTMIGGIITVLSVVVTRMPVLSTAAPLLPAPLLPAMIALPAGTTAAAVTIGMGWIAVVTDDDRILIFNADGSLRQEIRISAKPGG